MSPQLDPDWVLSASCALDEADSLFVAGAAQKQARRRCSGCPVRLECLADSLQCTANYGIWGGLTERERRALLRHFGPQTNWYAWLLTSSHPVAVDIRSTASPQVLALVRN